jgi:hypothetical protein
MMHCSLVVKHYGEAGSLHFQHSPRRTGYLGETVALCRETVGMMVAILSNRKGVVGRVKPATEKRGIRQKKLK